VLITGVLIRRGFSPVTMISVIGSATSATGTMLASAMERLEAVKKYAELWAPRSSVTASTSKRRPSQRLKTSERAHCLPPLLQPQAADLGAFRQPSIEHHSAENGGADHGLDPELAETKQLYSALEHSKNQRADRSAKHRSTASEDADATDHCC
jgi:hypothetical protein